MMIKFDAKPAVFAGSASEGFVRLDDDFSIISLRVNSELNASERFIGHHYPIEVAEEAVYHKNNHRDSFPGEGNDCDCVFKFAYNQPVVIQDPNSGKTIKMITVDVVAFAEDY